MSSVPSEIKLPDEPAVDDVTGDLFQEPAKVEEEPSHGVYVDNGKGQLEGVGEIILPMPLPVELVVTIGGYNYFFKLDRREVDESEAGDA